MKGCNPRRQKELTSSNKTLDKEETVSIFQKELDTQKRFALQELELKKLP
jgi:hypothetical protein